MPYPRHSWLFGLTAALGLGACLTTTVSAAADEPGVAFFKKDVRPLLETRCLKCHGGGEKVKGGLRLTSRDEVMKGGELGRVIDSEKAADSLLLRAINYRDEKLQMPPDGKLPPEAVAVLTKWVGMGAPFPPATLTAAKTEGR